MKRHGIPGMTVGVVTQEGYRVWNFGEADDSGTPVDDETLFEVGSISKLMAATLAGLVEAEGRLSLDDAVATQLAEYRGTPLGEVTLLELGTQTSCLPFKAPDSVQDEASLTDLLHKWTPSDTPGKTRIYSNLGIGVLGRTVARSLNEDYIAAVESRVLKPLGMTHSYYVVPEEAQCHYAAGHKSDGTPVRQPKGVFWAEAYGLSSTAHDLLLFLQAQMAIGKVQPELRQAIATTRKGYYRVGPLTQCLVWDQFEWSDRDGFIKGNSENTVLGKNPAEPVREPSVAKDGVIVGKTGATYGFGSYIAFLPSEKVGIVLLANRTNPIVDRVATARSILEAVLASRLSAKPECAAK